MDKSKLKDAGEKMEKADEKKKDTSTSDAGSAKKVSISIVNDLKKKIWNQIKLSDPLLRFIFCLAVNL